MMVQSGPGLKTLDRGVWDCQSSLVAFVSVLGVWRLCGSAFKIGEGTLPWPSENERAHKRSNDVWHSDTKEDMSDCGKGYIFGQHVWYEDY